MATTIAGAAPPKTGEARVDHDAITTKPADAGSVPAASSQAQESADALRRRIELYCRHLHTGVRGTLAIGYLRQIADDADDLTKLSSPAA
jgi:hypothetical protein